MTHNLITYEVRPTNRHHRAGVRVHRVHGSPFGHGGLGHRFRRIRKP
jgi:hypothetical protein